MFSTVPRFFSGTNSNLNDIRYCGGGIINGVYYICGDGGTILKSTNYGVTFFSLNSGTTLDLNEIWCMNEDSIRIAADSLTTLYTTNGGANWIIQRVYQSIDQPPGFRVDLKTLHFINFSTGWIAGDLFKTTNRGLGWQIRFKQTQSWNNSSNSIYFYDNDSGIVVGNRGDIQFTTNGGNNWFYDVNTQNLTTKNLNKFVLSNGIASAFGDSGIVVYADSITVAIEPVENIVPGEFKLYQNYPNPFNPVTKIKFQIPLLRGVSARLRNGQEGRGVLVKLIIYDIPGRKLETLVNENKMPGSYEVDWNAGNYPSGVYFYRLEAEGFIETKRMVIIK